MWFWISTHSKMFSVSGVSIWPSSTVLLTYLCPSLPVEHRPSTTPHHCTLFWAAFVIPGQLVPCCFSAVLHNVKHIQKNASEYVYIISTVTLLKRWLNVCCVQLKILHFLESSDFFFFFLIQPWAVFCWQIEKKEHLKLASELNACFKDETYYRGIQYFKVEYYIIQEWSTFSTSGLRSQNAEWDQIFFCVPQLYHHFGWYFCICDRFLIQPLR